MIGKKFTSKISELATKLTTAIPNVEEFIGQEIKVEFKGDGYMGALPNQNDEWAWDAEWLTDIQPVKGDVK